MTGPAVEVFSGDWPRRFDHARTFPSRADADAFGETDQIILRRSFRAAERQNDVIDAIFGEPSLGIVPNRLDKSPSNRSTLGDRIAARHEADPPTLLERFERVFGQIAGLVARETEEEGVEHESLFHLLVVGFRAKVD